MSLRFCCHAAQQEECGVKAATPKSVIGVYNTFFPTSAWGGGTHTINVGVHLVTDDAGEGLQPASENISLPGVALMRRLGL